MKYKFAKYISYNTKINNNIIYKINNIDLKNSVILELEDMTTHDIITGIFPISHFELYEDILENDTISKNDDLSELMNITKQRMINTVNSNNIIHKFKLVSKAELESYKLMNIKNVSPAKTEQNSLTKVKIKKLNSQKNIRKNLGISSFFKNLIITQQINNDDTLLQLYKKQFPTYNKPAKSVVKYYKNKFLAC